MSSLPTISQHQNNIIQELILNKNVVIDSVAGSGKSTTNFHIASHFVNKNILLLTYNAKLKLETREKLKKFNINNIEVHSYHSFCVKYYNNQSFNDSIIRQLLKNKTEPLKTFNYDLIVLDEAQDMSILYYELVCKIYKDNKNLNTQMCIFGDKNQSIFDFNKADQRFIELAPDIFNFNKSLEWSICNLPVSFRITNKMSLFINKCLLKNDRIISNKESEFKPRYIICDSFGNPIYSRPIQEIKYYLNLGYKPSDIFVLAASIKSEGSPIRQLENRIKQTMSNILVFVPSNDEEALDEKLLKDKLIFSTFHQSKGLERKVVIVFGFDNSYFKYYKRDANPNICPNELYVATTRGMEHLTVFHNYKNNYLPFINSNRLKRYCYFEENKELDITEFNDESKKIIDTPVTSIIDFLPQKIIDHCFNQLVITKNEEFTISKINISNTTTNDKSTESVGDITGIAIPSFFELKIKNKLSIHQQLINEMFENNLIVETLAQPTKPREKQHYIDKIKIETLTVEQLLYIANCWNSTKNGLLFKVYQITNYNWLTQDTLDKCIDRMNKLNITNESSFEYKVEIADEPELMERRLVGFIDCFDKNNNIIYEFKCVSKLTKEHYLQLAFYMYIFELKKKTDVDISYVLFNILTNEYYTISCDPEKLREIVKFVIDAKYNKKKALTNEEFIKKTEKVRKVYC
jgi:ATP:corrinoid adenosyltransferase